MTRVYKVLFVTLFVTELFCGCIDSAPVQQGPAAESALANPWLCTPSTYNPLAVGFTYPNMTGYCDWQLEPWWTQGDARPFQIWPCGGNPAPGFADVYSGINQTGRCARIEGGPAVVPPNPAYVFQYSRMALNGFWAWRLDWPNWTVTTIKSVTLAPATDIMLWSTPTDAVPTSCGGGTCDDRFNNSGTHARPAFDWFKFNTDTEPFDIANMSVKKLADGLGG